MFQTQLRESKSESTAARQRSLVDNHTSSSTSVSQQSHVANQTAAIVDAVADVKEKRDVQDQDDAGGGDDEAKSKDEAPKANSDEKRQEVVANDDDDTKVDKQQQQQASSPSTSSSLLLMEVALIVCDRNVREAMTMIKTVLMTTRQFIHFNIVKDSKTEARLVEKVLTLYCCFYLTRKCTYINTGKSV